MKACQALLNGYVPIVTHFEHVSQAAPGQATAEVRGRATFMVRKLKDWRVLRFMFFLNDLVQILGNLSQKCSYMPGFHRCIGNCKFAVS